MIGINKMPPSAYHIRGIYLLIVPFIWKVGNLKGVSLLLLLKI
jgi:hypothetical protein